MKFKVVEVYSGYNEMSINGDVVVKEGRSVRILVDELFEKLRVKICDDGGEDFWDEFSNSGVCGEDVGWYGCDEEGFNLVIGENNSWYNKLDNYGNWSEKEYGEWREFCGRIG